MARTRIGAIIRAGVDDREMVSALGININRVFTGVFILGAVLAGLAGVLGGSFLTLAPGSDSDILTFAIVVVIVGGAGSIRGALVASLLVGFLAGTVTTLVSPTASTAVGLAAMLVVLAFRPSGIFGRE